MSHPRVSDFEFQDFVGKTIVAVEDGPLRYRTPAGPEAWRAHNNDAWAGFTFSDGTQAVLCGTDLGTWFEDPTEYDLEAK